MMLNKIRKKISLKICLEAILLLVSFFMGFYFQWEIANFVFFILFIVLILHPIPSRITASGAVTLLVITAFLSIAKKDDWVETTAIWAYYAMIFTVFMSLNELNQDKTEKI